MAFTLDPLPYDKAALEPHISARTMEFHHGKHHATYVKTLNELVAGTPLENLPLEEIITQTAGKPSKAKIFNNAAQTWNHGFFWKSMKPQGGGKPNGDLATRIDAKFGSFESFSEEFSKATAGQFGSGWGWLVLDAGKLSIMTTGNADVPFTRGKRPLFCLDVWEHAYYLDYQNRRPDFIKVFLEHLVNWDFAEANLGAATGASPHGASVGHPA
jgi:Fe-Mn family superoxide dismutase